MSLQKKQADVQYVAEDTANEDARQGTLRTQNDVEAYLNKRALSLRNIQAFKRKHSSVDKHSSIQA